MTKGATPSSAWSAARPYAVLSIAAALLTIGLKLGAYLVTGSVGLFSDAAESVINVVAAVAALWALIYAARPPDERSTPSGTTKPSTSPVVWRAPSYSSRWSGSG